jgi:hypothetical protein
MQIESNLLSGSLPYMSPERIVLLFLGVLSILFGLFSDLFIPSPRRIVRMGIAILGIVAVCTVGWQQWHLK